MHILGHQTQLLHAFQTFLTQHVIACVIAAFIFTYVFLGRVQGPMGSRKGQVGEERLVLAFVRIDIRHQARGKKLAGVEVLGQLHFLAVLAVQGNRRFIGIKGDDAALVKVAGAAVHQGVGLVKAAIGWGDFLFHAQMPLARHIGAVAIVLQDQGEGQGLVA